MLQSFKEGVLYITKRERSPPLQPSNLIDNKNQKEQKIKEEEVTKKNNNSSISSEKPIPKCWCPISKNGNLVYCVANDRLNPGRAFYQCANIPSCSFFALRETNEEWKKMKETSDGVSSSTTTTTTTKIEVVDLKSSIMTTITSSNAILQQQQQQQQTSTTVTNSNVVQPHYDTQKNNHQNVVRNTTLLLMSPPLFDVHPQYKRTMTEEFIPENNNEIEKNVKDKKKPYQSSLPIPIPVRMTTRRKSHCGDSLEQMVNWSNSTLRKEGEVY